MSKKAATLVALGVAAFMISSATGCKVELSESGSGHSGTGTTGSGTNGSGTTTGTGTKGPGKSGGTTPHGTTPHGGTTATPPYKSTGTPGIALSETDVNLVCPGDDCTKDVTIRSTGTAPLKLGSFAVVGDRYFAYGIVCVNKVLKPGESCTFSVTYNGAVEHRATTGRLVIHQNLPGAPTYLALSKYPLPA